MCFLDAAIFFHDFSRCLTFLLGEFLSSFGFDRGLVFGLFFGDDGIDEIIAQKRTSIGFLAASFKFPNEPFLTVVIKMTVLHNAIHSRNRQGNALRD
jgi:hypothetical protein